MSLRLSPRMGESEPIRRCGWPDCRAACCVYGVWIGEVEIEDILAHAHLVQPFMPDGLKDPSAWFKKDFEKDPFVPSKKVRHTEVVDDPDHYGGTACVFMQPDYRCALQSASEAAGEHPWRFKPFYCILHPLDLDAEGRISLDKTRYMVSEPASCLRSAEKKVALLELFKGEIEYLGRMD